MYMYVGQCSIIHIIIIINLLTIRHWFNYLFFPLFFFSHLPLYYLPPSSLTTSLPLLSLLPSLFSHYFPPPSLIASLPLLSLPPSLFSHYLPPPSLIASFPLSLPPSPFFHCLLPSLYLISIHSLNTLHVVFVE